MIQIGEYELTATDVVYMVFTLVALKKIFQILFSPKVREPKKYEVCWYLACSSLSSSFFKVETLPQKNRTLLEVRNLRKEEKRCLVIVNDNIYDMSASRELYESNRDTFEAENGCGSEWESICARKFQFVGKLIKE